MDRYLLRLYKGDVFDEKTEHALAIDGLNSFVVPDSGKVVSQCPNPCTGFITEQGPIGLVLVVMFLLQDIQSSKAGVPVGFERISYHPI